LWKRRVKGAKRVLRKGVRGGARDAKTKEGRGREEGEYEKRKKQEPPSRPENDRKGLKYGGGVWKKEPTRGGGRFTWGTRIDKTEKEKTKGGGR